MSPILDPACMSHAWMATTCDQNPKPIVVNGYGRCCHGNYRDHMRIPDVTSAGHACWLYAQPCQCQQSGMCLCTYSFLMYVVCLQAMIALDQVPGWWQVEEDSKENYPMDYYAKDGGIWNSTWQQKNVRAKVKAWSHWAWNPTLAWVSWPGHGVCDNSLCLSLWLPVRTASFYQTDAINNSQYFSSLLPMTADIRALQCIMQSNTTLRAVCQSLYQACYQDLPWY